MYKLQVMEPRKWKPLVSRSTENLGRMEVESERNGSLKNPPNESFKEPSRESPSLRVRAQVLSLSHSEVVFRQVNGGFRGGVLNGKTAAPPATVVGKPGQYGKRKSVRMKSRI